MAKIWESRIIPFEKVKKINKEVLDYLKTFRKIREEDDFIYLENFCGYISPDILIIPKKIKEYFGSIKEDNKDFEEFFKAFFEKFLNYILEELANEKILYTISLANFPVDEYKLADSKIFKLLLLLEKKDEIINSIHLILANPHREIIEVDEFKRLGEVSEVDENILVNILTNPQYLYKTENGIIDNQYSPSMVLQYKKEESFDTLENRFIKFFLQQLSDILENDLKEFLEISALKEIKEEVDFALQSDIFTDIQDLHCFPSNSQVLMKRAGYRELFQIYRLLHLSFIPQIFKNLDIAFSLKDMATLWEYYVLIELLKELKNIYGNYQVKIAFEEIRFNRNNTYDYAEFKFENGLKLYYQKEFTSYSCLEFRPDFLIEKDGKRYIFDAKFRIFEDNKQDILKNMHYYKDSLNAVFSVAICFGKSSDENKKGKFCDKSLSGKEVLLILLEELLENPINFDGVGYINFKLEILKENL